MPYTDSLPHLLSFLVRLSAFSAETSNGNVFSTYHKFWRKSDKCHSIYLCASQTCCFTSIDGSSTCLSYVSYSVKYCWPLTENLDGSAQSAYTGDPYPSLADQYGFIILYPDSPNTVDKCWDVSSRQTLTHNGGGDSLGIVSATKYVMQKYAVDTKRVFATGTSSGAMMTNVLLGSYPDLFAAGSVWAGVAFGCFAGDGYDVWNGDCATGQVIKSGAKWKAIVQAAYPGYNGWRPKMQVRTFVFCYCSF